MAEILLQIPPDTDARLDVANAAGVVAGVRNLSLVLGADMGKVIELAVLLLEPLLLSKGEGRIGAIGEA